MTPRMTVSDGSARPTGDPSKLGERIAARLLGDAPLGLVGLDAQLRISFANASAALFAGGTVEQVVGQSSLELVHPDDLPVIAESLAYVTGGRATISTLFRLRGLDGIVRSVEGYVQAHDGNDPDLAFVVSVRDPSMSLNVDEFVQATLRSDLGDGMRALVRVIETEGDFGASIHWGGLEGEFAATVTLNPHIHALATHPSVVAALRDAPLDAPFSRRLRDLGVDAGGSDRRSFYAQHVGDGASTGLLVGWLPYDAELGAAGRNHFARAARLAALAFARNTDDERLRLAATTDSLTGLANRAALRERLDQCNGPTSLLLIDLDGFKAINDDHGHLTGDEILVAVAARLRAIAPEHTLVARLGGDEFAVLAGDLPTADLDALRSAFDHAVRAPIETRAGTLAIAASVGAASVEGRAEIPELLAAADRAMYERKRAGTTRRAERTEPRTSLHVALHV